MIGDMVGWGGMVWCSVVWYGIACYGMVCEVWVTQDSERFFPINAQVCPSPEFLAPVDDLNKDLDKRKREVTDDEVSFCKECLR